MTSRISDVGLGEPREDMHPSLSGGQCVRLRAWQIGIRFTPLWAETRRFARWLESEALPAARSEDMERALVALPDAADEKPRITVQGIDADIRGCERLVALLREVGIERLELDVRLEWNQITDILAALYAWRRAFRKYRRSEGSPDGIAGRGGEILRRLTGESGLRMSCTQTRIDGTTLHIAYSHCVTRFSRLVSWYERRHRHFHDHRALFQAAPLYAALGALLLVVPAVLYSFGCNVVLAAGVTAVGAVALFATLFLLLMSIGSVEYDNEEKAHRLTLAYERLRRYADRIARDLRRARAIQENLLPDNSKMPFPGRLEWASSFVPEAEVGGDYFDVAALDENRVAILFTDVSGHGMSAALVTAIIKTAFEGWKDSVLSMTEFAGTLNRLLCNVTPTESFAAVVLAIYDARARELSYVNCGHHPVPIRLRVDGEQEVRPLDQANARILGVLEEGVFEEARQTLRSGDVVLFVTDGIIEAADESGALYGSDRLNRYLRDRRADAPQALITGLVEQVRTFTAGREQTDDQTILAFRVR